MKVPRDIGEGEEHSKKSNTWLTDDFVDELRRDFGETPERRAEREAIEREFNEESERQISSMICPRCKSSVCRCSKEED